MPVSTNYQPEPHHQELGAEFYDEVKPAQFPKAIIRFRNQPSAKHLGLDCLTEEEWIAHFAKFQPLPDNLKTPLALRYHGHQFRNYNPQLGDGRGFLFAQLRDPLDHRLLDLATKGSGLTPWSRTADGRLTLKGAVREILATEMLEALGVNTSKTFSVIETGEALERHDEPSPTRAAVLVRLSHSHIRYGSFQRPAALARPDLIEKLLEYSLRIYFPDLATELQDQKASTQEKAAAFLARVAENAADTSAAWMLAGFVHGVLNTDNMNITGESFDYGPYRFLPVYDPEFTAAYFDHHGLYAYGRQPESVLWNLEQLATSLALLIPEKELKTSPEGATESLRRALTHFAPRFNAAMTEKLLFRLGVRTPNEQSATDLLKATYRFLFESKVGFEQFFFDWFGSDQSGERARKSPEAAKYQGDWFEAFQALLQNTQPLADVTDTLKHPYFKRSRPCTLLIDEIEALWLEIAQNDNWQPLKQKIEDIRLMKSVFGFNPNSTNG